MMRNGWISGAFRRGSVSAIVCAMSFALAACGEPAVEKQETALPLTWNDTRIAFSEKDAPSLNALSGKRRISSILNIASPMEYGEFVWSDDDVPPGRSWVLVDLAAQTISVFRGEHEIGSAVTLFGADEKPTPTGALRILAKLKDHRSNLYDAPMPYTLRLTYDGVAIHGSDVRLGAATHGCLGVPLDFAKHLFDELAVTDDVVIFADAQAALGRQLGETAFSTRPGS